MQIKIKSLQIFRLILITAVIILDFSFRKDESYYFQIIVKDCKFLRFKECFKNIEKKAIRHISDNLSEFSSNDDESDED